MEARTIPVATTVAQFCKHYPGMPYVSAAYPTSDHLIPFRLFWALYLELKNA